MEIFTKNSAKCTVFQSTICNKFSSLMQAIEKATREMNVHNRLQSAPRKEAQSTQKATRERNIHNVKAKNYLPVHWGLKISSNANAFAELQQIASQQEEATSPTSGQAQLPEDSCLSPPTTNEHYLACYTLPPTAHQIISWPKKPPPPMANSPSASLSSIAWYVVKQKVSDALALLRPGI
jgi:hypothetical protein